MKIVLTDAPAEAGNTEGAPPAPDKEAEPLVAAGTILYDVLIWKVVGCGALGGEGARTPRHAESAVEPLLRLRGHRGSIFALDWWLGESVATLASVSDDRTMRCWTLPLKRLRGPSAAGDEGDLECAVIPCQSARLWDCKLLGASVAATAGEDCSARLWDARCGRQLAVLQGHQGRSLWCLARRGGLMATGGADGSIKLWDLAQWLPSSFHAAARLPEPDRHAPARDATASLTLPTSCPPWELAGGLASTGSRQEAKSTSSGAVRGLTYARDSMVLVHTDRGRLHLLGLPRSKAEPPRWATLYTSPHGRPLTCCSALCRRMAGDRAGGVDAIAVGDAAGAVAVLRLNIGEVETSEDRDPLGAPAGAIEWEAHPGRLLLDVFWCGSLGTGDVLTASVCGELRWWRLPEGQAIGGGRPLLVATATSPFSKRIRCIDADPSSRILVAGDQKGNVLVFKWPAEALSQGTASLDLAACCQGAHREEAVTRVVVRPAAAPGHESPLVVTMGRDGAVHQWQLRTDDGSGPGLRLERCWSRKVPGIKSPEGLCGGNLLGRSDGTRFYGFHAADFVVWSEADDAELMRIPCGGWRRPWAANADPSSARLELVSCKDDRLHVHWAEQSSPMVVAEPAASSAAGRALRPRFHGREVLCSAATPRALPDGSILAVTGSEDCSIFQIRLPGDRPRDGGGTDWDGLCKASEVCKCIGGTVPRSLVVLDGEPGAHPGSSKTSFVLVSANSKEALEAWSLDWSLDPSGGEPIAERRLLSAKEPPRGLRPSSTAGLHFDMELRHLCAVGFARGSLSAGDFRAFLVLALSDARIKLAVFRPGALAPWLMAGELQGHRSPVLSASVAATEGGQQIAFTGSSDGCIAGWELSEMADAAEELLEPPVPAPVYKPRLFLQAAHASGVNALSAASVGSGGTAFVLSGGDDQSLHASLISIARDAWRAVDMVSLQGAHHSAVRGVWTDGTLALSVGLDQRLRSWAVQITSDRDQVKIALQPMAVLTVDVLEPACLEVLPCGFRNIDKSFPTLETREENGQNRSSKICNEEPCTKRNIHAFIGGRGVQFVEVLHAAPSLTNSSV
eukprot:CAMPEP_0177589634 /NCGR_PEP_ID=MMETSP0419_2-20121207/6926_1 /TAXON_ID=582737 /ORGANISM="Tetraselmis sp., Strain GSL018" /LENGTH=1078 /DNA_ID=CAMNT_0019080037 /DNA_START=592 /DNA_END=3825 /DNA_ORIENTATION=-